MKIGNFIKKWRHQEKEDYGGITSPSYKAFEKDYKKVISGICKEIGFELHSFSPMHYEFSAVLKNPANGKFYYIHVSDVRYWGTEWYERVLYRTMAHDKDWRGGGNNHSTLEELGESLLRLDKFENGEK